jgi:hypothetical protein
MTLSLNTLTPDTPLFAELIVSREQPLPEFDPWDPSYTPKFEGLQKPLNDLHLAMGAFDDGALAAGEEAMGIAADIEAFHFRALEDLNLLDLWRDPDAPRTPAEWFPYAQQVLAEAVIGLDPADLTAAVVISDIESPSVLVVSRSEPPAVKVQSERLDEVPISEPAPEPSAVTVRSNLEGPAHAMPPEFVERLEQERAVPLTLNYSAREVLHGLITAQMIREGVAQLSITDTTRYDANGDERDPGVRAMLAGMDVAVERTQAAVVDTGTPLAQEKPSPVPRKRGRRRRSHDVTEECTGTGLCKDGPCVVRPPVDEERQEVELPPIPPALIPELTDAEMDALLDIPIKFWVCPNSEHHDLRDDQGGILPSVAWDGDVARCLAPDCEHTNAEQSNPTQ